MKKKLTVYCINYGKSENIFLAIANNSIPFKIIGGYSDVEESLIFEKFIKSIHLPLIKKVCKDTGKSAILYRNQTNKILCDFINEILGCEVKFIQYSLSKWNNFIIGMEEYSTENSSTIEIDHPIRLEDKMLILMVKEGVKSLEKKHREIQEKIPRRRKRKMENEVRKI